MTLPIEEDYDPLDDYDFEDDHYPCGCCMCCGCDCDNEFWWEREEEEDDQ